MERRKRGGCMDVGKLTCFNPEIQRSCGKETQVGKWADTNCRKTCKLC